MAKAYWDKRAQQNRQRRAQAKAKRWNGGKLNRTQRNYVAGDYKASASDRAWGYRKNKSLEQKNFQTSFTGGRSKSNYAKLQRGEDPYKATYYYDGKPRIVDGKYGKYTSRKRFLTNDEKEAYKQTGDINTKKWKKNYKYQLLDGVDSDGKNFRSNLNLTNADGSIKWDGMNVARNRVKAGGSKWNYVGGFLKDTVGDFIFDSAKVADRYFGSALQGTLGVAETIGDLADTVTGKGKLSQVNFRQGLDNFKSSIKESDETGWAKSSSQTLKEANARQDLKNYEYLLRTKGQASADAYMESVKKAEPFSKVLEGVAGFGIDVLNPLDMTERIKGATKVAKNNAIKSAKEIVTGTGSQAVAFLPKSSQELYEVGLKHKDMLERMKAYKKYLQEEYIPKFGNKIDDEKAWKLFENSSQAEEYAQNFGYMANNIDQTINHSLDNGFNRAMGKAEEVKEVVKSNPATQNLGKFLDELKSVEVESTNEVFEQTYKGFLNKNGKVKEGQLFEMLDNIDDDFSYGMLDWLEKNDPKTYQKYVGDIADNVDDHVNVLIEQGSKVNESYLTNPTKKAKSEIFEAVKNKVDKLNDNYNKNALERMMKRGEYVAPKRESYGTLKQQFSDFANNVKEQVIKGDRTFYNKVNEVVGKIDIDKLAKDDGYKMQVIELLNKELFGANFIRQNIKKGSLKSFVEHLDDIRAYNVAKESGQFTFKPHGNYSGTKNGIHYMTNRNGKPNPIELNSSLFAPSLLDDMFDEKMSFVDSLVGVKHKSELTKPFEELKTLAKQEGFRMLDAKDRKLLSDIADGKVSNSAKIHLDEKMLNLGLSKLSDEQRRLYKSLEHRLNVRDSAYAEIKNMEFADFENYKKNFKGERSVLDDMYYKSIENSDKKSSEILNAIEDNRNAKFETTDTDYNNVGEVNVIDTAKEFVDKHTLKKAIDYKNEMKEVKRIADYHEKVIKFAEERGLKLPERTNAKVKLAKNQTLGSLPPVKNNLDGLKKLIKKEVEEMYTDPELYAKNKTMYDAVKKDYIKGLRSYGVPDNVYFEKAKNLKKLEEEIFQSKGYTKAGKKADEVSKPIDLVRQKERDELLKKSTYKEMSDKEIHERKLKRGKEGGSGTPKDGMKMNLQLLASKIDDMFDDLGKADIDTLSKTVEDAKNVSKTPLDKLVDDIDMNAENPFSSIKDGVDEILDEGVVEKKVRRKKTQEEIDQINATLERYNNQTPLDKIAPSDKKRLPRISELMEQGMIKEEAIKLIEKMKKGEVDIPSADVVTKPDRLGGVNTTTKANVNELRKVISDIGYGVNKESQLKPGEFINESTGEIEKVTDYILNKRGTNTHADVYDVVDELENVKPEDIMKPRTFKPDEGRKSYPSENPFKFTKEGESIELPKNKYVNQFTGEIEDMKKYRLDGGNVKNSNPNVYDDVNDVADTKKITKELPKEVTKVDEQMNELEHFENFLSGKSSETLVDTLEGVGANLEQPIKAPSKEIQKLIDYVEEEKLFSDFNESIGNDVPSFEKFKRWFNDGSKVAYNDNKVYDLYKRWLNSWKKGLTIYNPGWHVKNFFQNKGQSYLGIGMDAFKSQKNAREMFKNMKGLENSAKGILQKNGTYYSPSELTNIAKRSGVINGFNDLVKESRGLIPPLETAVDNSWLMKKLSMSEETARLHHFLAKIERGATPEEAVKSVNKYLFDYSKQNKFDRFMSDFVDPFWTYHKNSAKLISETGITSPIRTSNILRGTRGLEHGLDEKDRANEQKRDLQAPFGHFVDKKNKDRYTYQYDMDLFPSLEEFAPIEKDDVMSKLNPLIKLAIQRKDGEGNFGNKVVDKKEADWGEVTKDERKLEVLKEVNPFMNPLVKAYYKSKEHQEKADKGKQSQETSDKQILMDWLEYIFGNKGNYYRDVK